MLENKNLIKIVDISFKMTLQLNVKILTRYTELKLQFGLAKPR